MSTPLVSINLLLFNGKKYIKDCLDSVLAQTYPNIEILVIDNASTDNSVKIIKPLSPKIKLLSNEENFGFAEAHNQGIEKSRGKYVLCLNQDVVLDKDFVKRAVKILEKNSKIAAIQGKLLRLDNNLKPINIIDSTGLVMLKNRRIISRGQGKKDEEEYKEKQEEIFGVDGAAPIYRRKALKDVEIDDEVFDKDFFAYKEDVDLAWRLRLSGWKAWYLPEAIAWHARTSGESAATTFGEIIKERRKINKFSKYVSFKNQRLMQAKNELPLLFIKHLPWILPKEIGSWIYVLLFEHYTLRAIKDLFRQLPSALKKRKIIMVRKRIGAREMNKWFK